MNNRFNKALVIADSRESIGELTSAAGMFADNVYLVYMGNKGDAINAKKAFYMGDGSISFINFLIPIRNVMQDLVPEIILCSPTPNGRLAAGTIAVRYGVSVLSDCSCLSIENDATTSDRMVYGGMAIKKERVKGAVTIACPMPGAFEISSSEPVKEIIDLVATDSVRTIGKHRKEAKEKRMVYAKIVVGVGRGLGSAENLPMMYQFASALGAELGCTRPVAEENKWLPRELNIGISGATIKPNLYIACGISGQIQHMVGVNDANVIAAINKDENAAVFNFCDIGIVGDLSSVIPALIKKFNGD